MHYVLVPALQHSYVIHYVLAKVPTFSFCFVANNAILIARSFFLQTRFCIQRESKEVSIKVKDPGGLHCRGTDNIIRTKVHVSDRLQVDTEDKCMERNE